MGKIVVTRELDHSANLVWSVLEDFGGVHRYSAGVEASPINPGTPEHGVGAERRCALYDGNHIQERVTESVEERLLSLEVFDTSMPIQSAAVRFDLEESGGGSVLTMTMEYVVKYGLIGRAMDAMMMERMMTKSLTSLLAGLDEHLSTGKQIEKGWQPAQAA
jgi:uncharacterized protein YndB with AHSA1/START domain